MIALTAIQHVVCISNVTILDRRAGRVTEWRFVPFHARFYCEIYDFLDSRALISENVLYLDGKRFTVMTLHSITVYKKLLPFKASTNITIFVRSSSGSAFDGFSLLRPCLSLPWLSSQHLPIIMRLSDVVVILISSHILLILHSLHLVVLSLALVISFSILCYTLESEHLSFSLLYSTITSMSLCFTPLFA